MPSATAPAAIARCSFCLKPNSEVTALISGPGVYICDTCVALCEDILAEHVPQSSPRLAPWEQDMPLDQILSILPNVADAGSQVEENLGQWVRRARALGATWALVGTTLGMTRQSAWERFSGED